MTKKPAPKKPVKDKQRPPIQAVAPVQQPVQKITTPSEFTYQEPLAIRDEKIRALINTMNSEEQKLVVTAEEAGNPYGLRRPTGIIELDVHLAGGFPAGGCCTVSGADNVGKSWLLWKTLAMQQRLFGHAARLAVALSEGSMPYDQMLKAGMLIRVPDEILEQWQEQRRIRNVALLTRDQLAWFKRQLGEVYAIRGATGEDILTGVIEFAKTNAVSVIGVDSVNGLQPRANADKDLAEHLKMAAHASMMSQFWMKYIPYTTGLTGANQTTLLMTQQLRANQERSKAPSHIQQYLPEAVTTGARSTRHYKLIDIDLKEGKTLRKGDAETGKEIIGKAIKYDFGKGKAGTHDNLQGEYSYYYALNGIDNAGDLIVAALRRGIIQRHGSKLVVCQPDTGKVLDSMTAPSEKAMRGMIDADFEFELAIRNEIMAFHGIQCLYR